MPTNNESPDDSLRGTLEGDGWCVARIALTAVIAALLEAGDRSRFATRTEGPEGYVNRATVLLDAAEEKENERLDAVLQDGGI